jgi:hypothetical protein|tara:strand:+ start:276 stop:746 length:471 start_codon:yes stop_codon:yes gene_type:complete
MKVANKKQPYNWNRVKPGDVISFRYKSKSTGKTLVQSILVLNPRLNVKLKDGKTTRHLTGIKIEESNKVSLRLNARQIALLEQIGDFKKIDNKNNLYKLEIDSRFIVNDIKGIKKSAYDKISKGLNIQGQYRTYDYMTAKKSAVFLEPIRVFTDED